MHVAQLLHMFTLPKYIEVIVSALPKRTGRQIFPEYHLISGFLLAAGLARDALFQHLHHQRNISFRRLADQKMAVLRHHHITPDDKIILLPYFFQYFHKQIAAACRAEELLAPIATAGDEVSLTGSMKPA